MSEYERNLPAGLERCYVCYRCDREITLARVVEISAMTHKSGTKALTVLYECECSTGGALEHQYVADAHAFRRLTWPCSISAKWPYRAGPYGWARIPPESERAYEWFRSAWDCIETVEGFLTAWDACTRRGPFKWADYE